MLKNQEYKKTELIRGLCDGVCSLDINPQNDIVEVIKLGKNPREKALAIPDP